MGSSSSSIRSKLDEGRKLLKKAVDGDKKAAKRAHELFGKLREKQPGTPMIEAYYGSTLALLARDAGKPLEKAEKAQDALDILHAAVEMDPHEKEIRLLRANVCLKLPESFFHCAKTAIEDFAYLLQRHEQDKGYLTSR